MSPKTENTLHKHLEQDIERLGHEVERVKEAQEGRELEDKEMVKESFETLAEHEPEKREEEYTESDLAEVESEFFPDYMNTTDTPDEIKLEVERLLDLVFHKGLVKALKASKKEPAFIQDAFHDALAEKLVPALEERGML